MHIARTGQQPMHDGRQKPQGASTSGFQAEVGADRLRCIRSRTLSLDYFTDRTAKVAGMIRLSKFVSEKLGRAISRSDNNVTDI